MSNGAFKEIHFSVDVALLRELGERLVGKPHVALAELVKNSYDADANKCRIIFADDQIEIIDDGNGMTFDEFSKFWMRIGTTHKQNSATSPRLHRAVTGSKGIGRLSVQFLGNELEMWSISENSSEALHAQVDWANTRELVDIGQAGAKYRMEAIADQLPQKFKHGTKLIIRGLNQTWDETSIRDLAKELWFLQPPAQILGRVPKAHQFQVDLAGANDTAIQGFQEQMHAAFENWTAKIEGGLKNGRTGSEATVSVKFKTGEQFEQSYSLQHQKLDDAKFSIRVFNLSGRQGAGISVAEARKYFKKYGGVHVYDDGFRLPFYGGEEQDWLGLEIDHSHRLMVSKLLPEALQVPGGMRDLPTLGRVFGLVQVSTSKERKRAPPNDREKGSYLNVQITRDRLIDNHPFDDLRFLVRWAFDFYANRSAELRQKQAAKERSTSEPPAADEALLLVRTAVARLETRIPKSDYTEIQNRLNELEEAEQNKQEKLSNERVLLGALATAGMSAVALEHELGKEITLLRDSVKQLQTMAKGPLKEELSALAKTLENWIERATDAKLMFSPLMNASDRDQKAPLKARKVLEIISKQLRPLMRKIDVELDDLPDDLRLPRGTLAGWTAVFQNVFMNSVNAMLDSRTKRIRCSAGKMRDTNFILIEDTGVGVDLKTSEELFSPFVRKLKISEGRQALGLGGVGLGLTIVRMVASSFACDVSFIKPKAPFKSALRLAWREK